LKLIGNFMQTFLPFPDFKECARVIDDKRLWKQILEANQIYKIISKPNEEVTHWNLHPAVLMWKGFDLALLEYRDVFVAEWLKRRLVEPPELEFENECWTATKPDWLGNEKLHSSHRAALLAKNPKHYKQFGWIEEPKIEYYWPI